jgi:hypothetical protein
LKPAPVSGMLMPILSGVSAIAARPSAPLAAVAAIPLSTVRRSIIIPSRLLGARFAAGINLFLI